MLFNPEKVKSRSAIRQSSWSYIGRQNVCWEVREWGACQRQAESDEIAVFHRGKELVLAKKIKRLQGKHDKLLHSEKKLEGT